jgi:hypothetical protein
MSATAMDTGMGGVMGAVAVTIMDGGGHIITVGDTIAID